MCDTLRALFVVLHEPYGIGKKITHRLVFFFLL